MRIGRYWSLLEVLNTYDVIVSARLRPLRGASEKERFSLVRPTLADLTLLHVQEPHAFPERKLLVLQERLKEPQFHVWLVRDGEEQWVGWCHMTVGHGPNSRIGHTLVLAPDQAYLF